MRRILTALLLTSWLIPPAIAGELRFRSVDLVVDAGGRHLAAYQAEITYPKEQLYLVGIEGGEGEFAPAPYYDPRGLQGGRIVIAAFTTHTGPAEGPVRVARLHLALRSGEWPELGGRLVLAATVGGERIGAGLELVPHQGGEQ